MSTCHPSFSCSDCPTLNCGRQNAAYPDSCLTVALSEERLSEIVRQYIDEDDNAAIAAAADETVAGGYGKLNRVEEVAVFAQSLGAKKVGLATCIGLIKEARIFAQFLKSKGIESYSVLCKVGAIDKSQVNLSKKTDAHVSTCNPILQARLLNEQNTGLNVIIGLCVGHDTLFIKHSEAPVTYLLVKDRVFAHNIPAAIAAVEASLLSPPLEPSRA